MILIDITSLTELLTLSGFCTATSICLGKFEDSGLAINGP